MDKTGLEKPKDEQTPNSGTKCYDFVILGACTCLGRHLVEEMVKATIADESLKWCAAGVNEMKMEKAIEMASVSTGKIIDPVPTMVVNVKDKIALYRMSSKAKIIINCLDFQRLQNAEEFVKACIRTKTHLIDVNGSTAFLESIQFMHDCQAKTAGVYIVGGGRFDIILGDLGTKFTIRNFSGDLSSVNAYMNFAKCSGINYSTYKSAIYGDRLSMPSVTKALFDTETKHWYEKLPVRYDRLSGAYCMAIPSCSVSMVNRSQRYRYYVQQRRPVNFSSYLCRPSVLSVLLVYLSILLLFVFLKFDSLFGKDILSRHHKRFTFGLVSEKGLTKKQAEKAEFSMILYGKGYSTVSSDPSRQYLGPPDKEIITKVTAPEPCYITTSICMLQSALVLHQELNSLPCNGGVYTPAVAFENTTLIDRLSRHDVKFHVVAC